MKTALPTAAQMKWQDMEMGMFCHFGLNTFNDREWGGTGQDEPTTFNPTELDARQWARTAKEAGLKYLILTAKHHDGFCLWQTKTTTYSLVSSPWKEGKGDVVMECAKACEEEAIKLGIYLSPWDKHEACYMDEEAYNDFYVAQLTELLTGYGQLVEIWLDGGAGSEGRNYDWKRIMATIKHYQPEAMIFNLGEPTIRWAGNEDGVAPPYPTWNTTDERQVSMFTDDTEVAERRWLPAECDVPIRRYNWFWHENDEINLLTKNDLLDIYYRSVGHGANLLINIGPDRRGLLPKVDCKRLIDFGDEVGRRFDKALASTTGEGYEFTLHFDEPTPPFNHLVIQENLSHGELVHEYEIDIETYESHGFNHKYDNVWYTIGKGSAIGHKKN